MAAACWICSGRGEGQVVLRPDGRADGRKVCHVCARRLLQYLGAVPAEHRVEWLSPLWPGLAGGDAPEEPEHLAAWTLFRETVSASLAGVDACERCRVALGYLELGSLAQAFEALGLSEPTCDGLNDRLLTSLLSRLLHPAALAPGAQEALEQVLYPGLSQT